MHLIWAQAELYKLAWYHPISSHPSSPGKVTSKLNYETETEEKWKKHNTIAAEKHRASNINHGNFEEKFSALEVLSFSRKTYKARFAKQRKISSYYCTAGGEVYKELFTYLKQPWTWAQMKKLFFGIDEWQKKLLRWSLTMLFAPSDRPKRTLLVTWVLFGHASLLRWLRNYHPIIKAN